MAVYGRTGCQVRGSTWSSQQPPIGYFRDSKTDKEIDVVVSLPRGKVLIEVKYRENARVSEKDAIVEWANAAGTEAAILITKNSDDYGRTAHATRIPVMRIPAFAFLYLLGHEERQSFQQ